MAFSKKQLNDEVGSEIENPDYGFDELSDEDELTKSVKKEKKIPAAERKAERLVKVLNRINRVIELDFGRDNSVRIDPKSYGYIPTEFMDHDEVRREKHNLTFFQ